MECIYSQYSHRFFFCVLYNISESLSRFWSYVRITQFWLLSVSYLFVKDDFSSQCPYLCYSPQILVPIFGFVEHMWVLFNVSIFCFLCKMQSQVWSSVFTFVSVIVANYFIVYLIFCCVMSGTFCQRHYYDLFSLFSNFLICLFTF